MSPPGVHAAAVAASGGRAATESVTNRCPATHDAAEPYREVLPVPSADPAVLSKTVQTYAQEAP